MPKVSTLQSNFNGGELSPLLYGRPEIDKYGIGLKTCLNFVPMIQGPVNRRSGTGFVVEVKDSSVYTRIIRFEFNVEQAYILELGNLYARFIKDHGQIESGGSPVELTTTYTTAQLSSIRFVQSTDTIYLVHPEHPVRKIERLSDTSWTITDLVFRDGPYLPTNSTTTTLGLSGTTGSVTVTASAVTGINNDAGFAATDVDRIIRWKDAAGNWTWLQITAFTSTTVVTADIVGADASATTATINWRLGLWSETTGYPAAIGFHQDRLFLGGSTDYPQRNDGSVVNDFENFRPTELDGTVADDNAVTRDLAADSVNAVLWYDEDDKGLLIGTAGGIWVIQPNDNGGLLTPSNITAKRSRKYGSAAIQPVRIGGTLLFVQKALRKVRELFYLFEDDGFKAPDMTLIAEHITKSGVTDIAYQADPQSIAWLCLTDGTLLSLTYEKDQAVIGWARHSLGGYSDAAQETAPVVESVATIPNPDGDADELYMVVKRYINGTTKRYIEYMKPFWTHECTCGIAFFVDSGLAYDGAATTTLTGLDHLEGETVSILSEGATHPSKVVSSGSITLDRETTQAVVGLGYTSDIETLRPNEGARDGAAQGKLNRMHRVIFRLLNSSGGKYGPDVDSLDPVVLREGGDPMDTSVPFFTGDIEQEWDGDYSSDNHVFFRQDQPLPTILQAIMGQMVTQDRG
jgi:hypothetical protein